MNKYASILLSAVASATMFGCSAAQSESGDPLHGVFEMDAALAGLTGQGDAVTATMQTDLGAISCSLRADVAPHGVANFIGLVRGIRPWKNPNSDEWVKRPFYDGLLVHRVVHGSLFQGGDPLGIGTGGPGYTFADEIGTLKHEPGALAYANSGANTNGSQFYIAATKATMLDGKYTIFGLCSPKEIIDAIVAVPTDSSEHPLTPIRIQTIAISR